MTTQTSQGWVRVKMGDVVELQQGLAINKKSKHLIVEKSSLALLRITDLINNKQEQFIDENLIPKQFIADEKSLIYSRTGQVGLVFKNRKGVVHNNCFKIFFGERLNKDFLFYSLKQPRVYDYVNQIAQKAAQPDLTHTAFKSLEIDLPDLVSQNEIANVLCTYDNLIENNNRRIKILEGIVQKIYTEWFVNFRFPEHKSVNSSKDKLPTGWSKMKLNECVSISRGKSYSSADLIGDIKSLPFINLKCIKRFGGFRKDGIKSFSGKYKDSHIVHKGDIVMAVTDMTQERMIVARSARIPSLDAEFGVISMDLIKVEPKENCDKNFLYAHLRWSDFSDNVKNHANGANVLHLTPDRITDYSLVLPPLVLQKQFSSLVFDLFEEIDSLELSCENLSKSRDLLIPQLVSGKLEIKS